MDEFEACPKCGVVRLPNWWFDNSDESGNKYTDKCQVCKVIIVKYRGEGLMNDFITWESPSHG